MGNDKSVQLKDLSAPRRLALKAITKVQKFLLKYETTIATNMYYFLAKLHFSVYFSNTKDLETEILNDTHDGYAAVRRHSCLVVNALFKDSQDIRKKMIRSAARGSFVKNIILNAKL